MAINNKTFIKKSNTIIKDSYANTSLNPILELNYGKMITRILLYFDHEEIKKMVEDKTYPDINKLKHFLHMTNASSIQTRYINEPCLDSEYNHEKERATSFDLIFFYIPKQWDSSRGFDYVNDLYNGNHRAVKTDGCNWYNNRTFFKWDKEGIYTTEELSREVDLFTSLSGNKSNIVFAIKHFEYGNENLTLDISDTVNDMILGKRENNGIAIAFSPLYEEQNTKLSQYIGFFSHHTHSFYEPYIESVYCENIEDDRINFCLNKLNKLYFYVNIGGKSVNLDELPICHIEDKEYKVNQYSKGIYYVEVEGDEDFFEPETMYYDYWSNIIYKGRKLKDVELNFTVLTDDNYYNIGLPSNNKETSLNQKFTPNLYGIKHKEHIKRGDIRKVTVECLIPYTSKQLYSVDNIEYRLYTMSGVDELDVISWSNVERAYNDNYFLINTSQLIPSRYYIDIRIRYDNELIHHYKQIEFDIVNDVTEVYV